MSLARNQKTGLVVDDRADAGLFDGFSEIECSQFPSLQLCVVAFLENSPLYFSSTTLSEINRFARMTHNANDYPFRYRVLSSRKKGVFSLGGDLAFFRGCIARSDRVSLARYAHSAVDSIWASITSSGRPDMLSVALVQGEAQGGGFEAALAAHVLVAEKGATFGFPEGLFGLFPGMGAKQLLSARASADVANRLMGSARRYSAEELFEEGIVDFLVDGSDGWNFVYDMCSEQRDHRLWKLRERFAAITRRDLDDSVEEWISQAMNLSERHLKVIDYLLVAQQRISTKRPVVRVI